MGGVSENPVSKGQGQPVLGTVDRILFRVETGISHGLKIRNFRMDVKQEASTAQAGGRGKK